MSEPLDRFRFLLGDWEGEEAGKAGDGVGSRTYRLLFDRFIEGRNRSEFPPQEANPTGEVHEDLTIFAAVGDAIVLREFHSEGFVITYRLGPENDGTHVFHSQEVDNAPPGYRARLTIRPVGDDAFEELFELAAEGEPFEEFIRNRWSRRS